MKERNKTIYFDVMVSNVLTATVVIRPLSFTPTRDPKVVWAYEVTNKQGPPFHGTVDWKGKDDLDLVYEVLQDYHSHKTYGQGKVDLS